MEKKDKYRKKCNYRLNCKKAVLFLNFLFVCMGGEEGQKNYN